MKHERFELTRQILVRAIHNLENPRLNESENRALYGPCYRQHGHDYKVQVTVHAPLDPKSGWILDRDRFDCILKETIIDPYDGSDLNELFENTSCEALAYEFYRILEKALEKQLPHVILVRVGIQETRKNYFEFPPVLRI